MHASQARSGVRRNGADARGRPRTLGRVTDGDGTAGESPGPPLVEPARRRLIELAAAAVADLPADEVPAPLRAIARFTPAKRARLGGIALAAALESNDGFRTAVAEAASAGAAEPAAVTAAGAAAADPVDVQVFAYLLRPDGWEATVTAAAEAWEQGRGSAAEIESLRAALDEARRQARGEPARTREAVAAAITRLEAQASGLQQELRERSRHLRAAERDRDAARQERDAERERAARREADAETELRRLRRRLAEANQAADASRRAARTRREVDDARLALLVETVVQAATGLRRELSLPPVSTRPADAVAAAAPDPGAGYRVDDSAALDDLLALPNAHLVVDGYNVTKTGYPELPLADQRARLVTALAALGARCGAEVTVAFDGDRRPPVQPAVPRGVRVLFSAADEIADDLIRRLVAAEPAGRPVVVVTNDQQIVRDTRRDAVWSAPSEVLLARLR